MEDIPELEPQLQISGNDKLAQLILLTGYLGSGKTTLISHILKEQKEYKVAVIQNEFSDEMGIEAPLMQDSEGKPFDKFYELPNGCICCSAKDDLLIAIEFLVTSEKYNLDFILVETNGLADPSSTIKIFWVDDDQKFPAELKSIHTVVPVHRFEELKKNDIFVRQLIFSDIILVNQIDRCKEEEIQKVEESLKLMNPLAKLKRTTYCQMDLKEIFEIDGFTLKQQKLDFIDKLDDFDIEKHAHKDESIKCEFLQFKKTFKSSKDLEILLGTLVWESEDKYQIHRMKGLVNVEGDEYMYAIQGVEDIFEVKKTNVKWNCEEEKDRVNKILFICEGIEKKDLEKSLELN